MLAGVAMHFLGRMGMASVYKDLGGGSGCGWGKRDDFVVWIESFPIYTCDRDEENGPYNLHVGVTGRERVREGKR